MKKIIFFLFVVVALVSLVVDQAHAKNNRYNYYQNSCERQSEKYGCLIDELVESIGVIADAMVLSINTKLDDVIAAIDEIPAVETDSSTSSGTTGGGIVSGVSSWPPSPQNIVNVDSGFEGQFIFPWVSPHTIYEVPSNKYLVVTNFVLKAGSVTSELSIVEDKEGVMTTKHNRISGNSEENSQLTYSSTVGLVFAPGSKVGLHSNSADGFSTRAYYSFTGYLVGE